MCVCVCVCVYVFVSVWRGWISLMMIPTYKGGSVWLNTSTHGLIRR